jgi:hypothetical protein
MALTRIGSGPFTAIDFWPPDHDSVGGDDPVEGELDRCACCGSKVKWRVILRNAGDGLNYVVGRTCAKRAKDFIGTPADQVNAELRRCEREYKARQVVQRELDAQRAGIPYDTHRFRCEAFAQYEIVCEHGSFLANWAPGGAYTPARWELFRRADGSKFRKEELKALGERLTVKLVALPDEQSEEE